jgi:hypothetical protein
MLGLRHSSSHAFALLCARAMLISPYVPGSSVRSLFSLTLCSSLISRSLSTDEEEDEEESHSPPPPSSSSTPPPPFHSSPSNSCRSPRHVVLSARDRGRYSPLEVESPGWKRRLFAKQVSYDFDDEEPKKRRKRRKAVTLACYFCRRRKIACRQPSPGSFDRTCK